MKKKLSGKIQSLISYSQCPLRIFIWNTHKMSDTQLINHSQFWQSGSTTPPISHVQVNRSCRSQSASHFQVSSRKTKVLVLDYYGNRLFTLDLGLPKTPLSFSCNIAALVFFSSSTFVSSDYLPFPCFLLFYLWSPIPFICTYSIKNPMAYGFVCWGRGDTQCVNQKVCGSQCPHNAVTGWWDSVTTS